MEACRRDPYSECSSSTSRRTTWRIFDYSRPSDSEDAVPPYHDPAAEPSSCGSSVETDTEMAEAVFLDETEARPRRRRLGFGGSSSDDEGALLTSSSGSWQSPQDMSDSIPGSSTTALDPEARPFLPHSALDSRSGPLNQDASASPSSVGLSPLACPFFPRGEPVRQCEIVHDTRLRADAAVFFPRVDGLADLHADDLCPAAPILDVTDVILEDTARQLQQRPRRCRLTSTPHRDGRARPRFRQSPVRSRGPRLTNRD